MPALVVLFLAVSAMEASAAGTLIHQYRLNQWTGYTDDLGGPSLVPMSPLTDTDGGGPAPVTGYTGGAAVGAFPAPPGAPATTAGCAPGSGGVITRLCQGYVFAAGQGLTLSGGLGAMVDGPDPDSIPDTFDDDFYEGDYSIVLDMLISNGAGARKIIDFENRGALSTNNNGLYITDPVGTGVRKLQFWRDSNDMPPGGAGTSGLPGSQTNVDTSRIVITRQVFRDGLGNPIMVDPDGAGPLPVSPLAQVTVYDDTVFQFSFNDTGTADGVFKNPAGIINFFVDDLWSGTNQGGGFVDTIRIYGGALDSAQVFLLSEVSDDPPPPTPQVPEPGSLLMLGTGMALVARQVRRRRTAQQ